MGDSRVQEREEEKREGLAPFCPPRYTWWRQIKDSKGKGKITLHHPRVRFFNHLSTTLEKAMTTHSSTLAWIIPWMEPGGLQSMGSLRVGHD